MNSPMLEPRPFQHKPSYSLRIESSEFTAGMLAIMKMCADIVDQQEAVARWESEGGAS